MKEVLTTGQVAKLCNVTIRTVIKWFENGHLEGFKIPGSRDRRFPREKVIQFMQEHGFPLGELAREISTRKRILVVDDEEAVLTLLGDYLRGLGLFDVETACNGYEAGMKTQAFRPHLLIIDHILGDVTGTQVAESIRADAKLKGTRIMVMSGFLKEPEVKEVLAKGVDEFLRKPFELEAVRDKIFQLLKVG